MVHTTKPPARQQCAIRRNPGPSGPGGGQKHAVPLDALPSRSSRRCLRSSSRLDALWELSGQRWGPLWSWRALVEQLAGTGWRLPNWCDLSISRSDAIASLWARRRTVSWPIRLRILAAVYHWKVLTTQQVASIVGTQNIRGDLKVLWQAGLLRRGELQSQVLGAVPPSTQIWKVDWDAPVKELLSQLTPWERYGLLAGTNWKPYQTNWSHDLLVADTTLRVAELVPAIAAVYGEEMASADRLTDLPPSVTKKARGDAVWVRDDGLRIVAELSISAYPASLAKAERWARVLEADQHRDLFVLFLVAAPPGQRASFASWSLGAYRRAVAEAAWSSLSAVQACVPERMGVAALSNWFPATGKVSPDFPRLPVWRPTGPPKDRFEPANLADGFDVAFDSGFAGEGALAPIIWAPLAYAMPWWLAEEAVPFARQHLPDAWKVGLLRHG